MLDNEVEFPVMEEESEDYYRVCPGIRVLRHAVRTGDHVCQ